MSVQKTIPTQNITERTHFVGRHAPHLGDALLYVLREEVSEDGTLKKIGEKFRGTFTQIAATNAAATYLLACQSAVTLQDLFNAESKLYDDLVAEGVL